MINAYPLFVFCLMGLVPPLSVSGQTVSSTNTSSTAATTLPLSVLYAHEFVLQTSPRRILYISIYDRGNGTALQTVPRYVACARYSTTSTTTYAGPLVAGTCLAQAGQVTASTELEQLSRELFVDKLLLSLNPARLFQDNGAELVALKRQAAQAKLADELRTATLRKVAQDTAYEQRKRIDVKLKKAPDDAALLTKSIQADTAYHQATRAYMTALALADSTRTEAAKVAATTDLVDGQGKLLPDILDLKPSGTDEKLMRDVLLDAYLDFVRQQTQYAAAPKAGVVEMAAQVPLSLSENADLKKEKKKKGETTNTDLKRETTGSFRPDSLQMEIEDGQITELKTVGIGQIDGKSKKLNFETYAPIGISSDLDLNRAWHQQRLWTQSQNVEPKSNNYYIRLPELLRYYPILSPRAGDRSPADGLYIFKPNDPLPKRTLTKIATTKILQARVYTDLVGVSGDRPNGLVQLEVNKKFTFGTSWSKQQRWVQGRVLGYVQPFVTVNKVEQQNRFLPLRRTSNDPFRYSVNSIDLLRYTNLRIGSDLNLVSLRLPRFMSDVSFDASVSLNRVDIRDSVARPGTTRLVRVDSTLNVVSYGFGIKLRIRPDSRYGFQSRMGIYRYSLINDQDQDNKLFIQQTPTPRSVNADAHTQLQKFWYQGIVQYELLGWVKLSENSELFIRPQFSHLLYESHHTYFQFQVGYQFDVFSRNREAPAKPATLFPGAN